MHEAYEVRFDDVDVIECTVEYQVPVKSAGTPRRASAKWTNQVAVHRYITPSTARVNNTGDTGRHNRNAAQTNDFC